MEVEGCVVRITGVVWPFEKGGVPLYRGFALKLDVLPRLVSSLVGVPLWENLARLNPIGQCVEARVDPKLGLVAEFDIPVLKGNRRTHGIIDAIQQGQVNGLASSFLHNTVHVNNALRVCNITFLGVGLCDASALAFPQTTILSWCLVNSKL